MGLRHNPVSYLILSNGLLWGLPLAIIHTQSLMDDRHGSDVEVAQLPPTPMAAALMSLEPLTQPDPASSTTPGLANPPITMPAEQAPARPLDVINLPLVPPDLFTQLKGADGLGGPITLANRNSPLVPIAARAERLQWERSNDALAALPLHWRDSLRQELGKEVRVSQAATVRLPVRELAERQEVPVIINDQGMVEGLVEPRHQRTREAVETWAARQQPAEPGTVQVLLVAVEPLPSTQE